jgi:hypothetical protein
MVTGGPSGYLLRIWNPGEMLGHGIVELQFSRVAQLQDRGRGEELGVGSDAVERCRGCRILLCDVGKPIPLAPDQFLIVDDADGKPGLLAVRHSGGGPGIQDPDGGSYLGMARHGTRVAGRRQLHRDAEDPQETGAFHSCTSWLAASI